VKREIECVSGKLKSWERLREKGKRGEENKLEYNGVK